MILVEGLAIRVGSFALNGTSFEVPEGRYGVLMGGTGSGKTTILEAICGLRRISAGRIVLGGRDVTRLKPAERNIGYVPQDGALFSTMTVREHLAFSLRIREAGRPLIDQRVAEMSNLLSIEHLLDRRPQGLSGGEAQRVALGRALSSHPQILCLDEPLSSLDEDMRDQMYGLLESIQQRTGMTTLHVTHSLNEAQRLGDRVLKLVDGCVQPVFGKSLERTTLSPSDNDLPSEPDSPHRGSANPHGEQERVTP